MAFILLALILLLPAYYLVGTEGAVYLSASSQFVLLLWQISRRRLTGFGSFVFMYFLFFSIRSLYIIIEDDYPVNAFIQNASLELVGRAAVLSSLGLCAFSLGHFIFLRFGKVWLNKRLHYGAHRLFLTDIVLKRSIPLLLSLQLIAFSVILKLSQYGSAYGSPLGAYAYDMPIVLQAISVFSSLSLTRYFVQRKSWLGFFCFLASLLLLIATSYTMRDLSLFRGVYLAGLLGTYIAIAYEFRRKVGYFLLIFTIVIAQPTFADLGRNRRISNENLFQQVTFHNPFTFNGEALTPYWDFYNSSGDMNIFDTFMAASEANPSYHPYLWSWLYAPLHFIPRFLWSEKPIKGITQDLSFLQGYPYSPGILGFFYMDGGFFWMLLSMSLLGSIISFVDGYIDTMRSSSLKSCLYGLFVVNCMLLTRIFLWQFLTALLYSVIPCVFLFRFFRSCKLFASNVA